MFSEQLFGTNSYKEQKHRNTRKNINLDGFAKSPSSLSSQIPIYRDEKS